MPSGQRRDFYPQHAGIHCKHTTSDAISPRARIVVAGYDDDDGFQAAWPVAGFSAFAFHSHGNSSCRRDCLISAMRLKTSASQTLGVDVVEARGHDEG
jgi:hypothetical protein